MSASEGLLGWLSNVQSMESSIASTMLELSLKLASVASTSFLLVVESGETRRIAGSPQFVDQFRQNSLTPRAGDAVVTLSHTAALEEAPLLPESTASLSCFTTTNQLCSSKGKRRNLDFENGPSPKKSLWDLAIKNETIVLKTEPEAADGLSFSAANADDFSVDGDSDVEILAEDSGFVSSTVQTNFTRPMDGFCQTFAHENQETLDCDGLIAQMHLNSMKIETLQTLHDTTQPFQKGSIECRLISSLFYDFGKELRRLCPFDLDFANPLHRDYFARHVDAFIARFPNLELHDPNSAVSRLKVEVGSNKRYTPQAYLRVNARNGFKAKNPVDKRPKKKVVADVRPTL